MNKKGQIIILRWMAAIFIIFLTFGFIDPFKTTVLDAQSSLQCSTNTSLTTGTQLLCLGLDTTLWYFILAMFVVGVGFLWDKGRR